MCSNGSTTRTCGDAVVGFRDALRAHQQRLNRLNVYPVPDGDTGTNMALTLESVVTALDGVSEADRTMVATCKAISHGSLMGARGNSGVILSQVLRGLCGRLDDAEVADGASVAAALSDASTAAYGAVMRPVEGTILTVVREASEAAVAVGAGEKRLVDVLDAAVRSARDALARTPELLPVLKEAGVVDAGGAGFVLFLDALLQVVDGRPVPEAPEDEAEPAVGVVAGHGDGGAGRRDRGSPLRGDVPARRARREDRRLQGDVDGDRRVDRGRGRRRAVELPHPRRRHRGVDRGRHRGRPAPPDPGHRPGRPGGGGAVGPPGPGADGG